MTYYGTIDAAVAAAVAEAAAGDALSHGHGVPVTSSGHTGQLYIDVDTRILYGPRAANGTWAALSALPAPGA